MRRAITLASSAFFSSIFAFIFIYLMIFTSINRAPDDMTVKMYVTANYVNKKAIKETVINDEVKAVIINFDNEDDEYYSSSLETQGLLNSDILIIPENVFDSSDKLNSFIEIADEMFNENNSNKDEYNLLIRDEMIYGIIVYKKDLVDIFGQNIEFQNENETYIIAINRASKVTNKAIHTMFKLLKKSA